MKLNINWFDRFVRLTLSILIGILYFSNGVAGVLGTVLLIIAVILFATAIIGICPLYQLLHISTKSSHE